MADAYVAAAVNVESVTVGIYFQIKQGEVLYTGGKQGEVSAMEHGEVFQRDVPAILEADRFVAYTRQAAFFAGQSFAVDRPGPLMVMFSRPIPQIREFFQWLCPKSWYLLCSLGSAESYPSSFPGKAAMMRAPCSR